MTTFIVMLTTGQQFTVTENPNQPIISALNSLFQSLKVNPTIISAVFGGEKLLLHKTIAENGINNGSRIVLKVENFPATPGMNNNYNNNYNNNAYNINAPQVNKIPIQILFENMQNLNLAINFLVNYCKIPQMILDSRGHCLGDWEIGRKSGPAGYLKNYSPPLGFIGIGLQVFNLYDNGDNTWIGNKNQPGEWYIAYHGIKSIMALYGILLNGFRRGAYQECEDEENINPLTRNQYNTCGKGVYFIPDFDETKKYIETFNYLGINYRVILMCRINPNKVRIADIGDGLESWIINGDELNDPNGKKYDDEVRICRILVEINKNNN